jgi:FixJ family two-component response regulator
MAYIVTDNQQLGINFETVLDACNIEARWFRSASEFLAFRQPEVTSCLLIGQTLLDMSGFDLQRKLAHTFSPPIIFLSDDGDIPSCVRAIKEGALDFLALPVITSRLVQAMEAAFNRHASAITMQRENAVLRGRWQSLTSREAEVMRYVVDGFLNKQTAGALRIAENTVQVHRGRVMRKMRADSLAALVCMALELMECDEPSLTRSYPED